MLKKNFKTKWLSKAVSMLCVLAMILSSFTVVMADAVTVPMVNRTVWCYASVADGLTTNLVYKGNPLSGDTGHELVVLGTTFNGNVKNVTGSGGYYPDQISYMADMNSYLDITESTRSSATMTAIVAAADYAGQAKFVPALIGKVQLENGVQTVYIPMTDSSNWQGNADKDKWLWFNHNNGISISYTLDKFDDYAIIDGVYLTEEEKANSLGVYEKWGENFKTSTGETATWYKIAADWTRIFPGIAMIAPAGVLSSEAEGANVYCAALSRASFTAPLKECTDFEAPEETPVPGDETVQLIQRNSYSNVNVASGVETSLTYTGTPLSSDGVAGVVFGTWGKGKVSQMTGATGYYPDQISYVADTDKYLNISECTRSASTLTAFVAQAVYNDHAKFVPALIGKKVFESGEQSVFIPMTNTENWLGHSGGKDKWWNFEWNNSETFSYTLDKFDDYAIVDGAYLTDEEKANSLGIYENWGEGFLTSTGEAATWYKVEADWTKIHPGFALIAPTGNLSSEGEGENGFCAVVREASITTEATYLTLSGTLEDGTLVSEATEIPVNALLTLTGSDAFDTDVLAENIAIYNGAGTTKICDVTVDVHPAIENAYIVTPDEILAANKLYTLKAGNMTLADGRLYAAADYKFLTTSAIGKLMPPTGIRYTSDDSSIVVMWNAPETGDEYVEAESYEVYIDGTMVGETTAESYTISGLVPGTAYQIKVVAKAGTLAKESETVECYTTGVVAFDGILVKYTSDSEIGIKWEAVVGAENYSVVRDGNTEKAVSVSGTEYTDFNLIPDAEYTYTVTAVGGENAGTAYEITVKTDADYGTKEFVLYKNNKTSERFEVRNLNTDSGNKFELTSTTDKALTGDALALNLTGYGAGAIEFQKGSNEYNRANTDKDGLFMYLKVPNNVTGNIIISFPNVSESVHYPYGGDNKYAGSFKLDPINATNGYIPVFLPFSEPALCNTGIKAVGILASGVKASLYIDDLKFVDSTPIVEKVFYRNADGVIVNGLIPTDISEIVVKFNTPMEESTLSAITVKSGDKTASYTGTYNPSDMTWNMKLNRTLESNATYTVNVPVTVRSIDKYGKKTGTWKDTAVTFDINEKVTGTALENAYNTTFNTESSKLQVTMDIDKASGKVDVEIINLTGDMSKKAITYFAAYEVTGGIYKMLASVKSGDVTLSGNVTTYSVTAEDVSVFANADIVKAMTWEGNNSMIPLTSAVTE